MAASKIVFVVLAVVCLAQASVVRRQTTSASQSAMDASIANIKALGDKISQSVTDGTALLQKYVDNSTDYSATFKVNMLAEISSIIQTHNKAIDAAEAIAIANNKSISSCFTEKREQAKKLALDVTTEVAKCAVTKLMQFKDLAVKLINYGKQLSTFVPERIAKVKSCSTQVNEFFKLICVNTANMESVTQLTSISAGVASTVSTATAMYATITTDLSLCAASKLFSFRKTIQELSLTVGSCTVKSATSWFG